MLTQSAWFRPHNRSEDIDNLYFVGAGTHPARATRRSVVVQNRRGFNRGGGGLQTVVDNEHLALSY